MSSSSDATQNAVVKFAKVTQTVEGIQKIRQALAYSDAKFFTIIGGVTYHLHT